MSPFLSNAAPGRYGGGPLNRTKVRDLKEVTNQRISPGDSVYGRISAYFAEKKVTGSGNQL